MKGPSKLRKAVYKGNIKKVVKLIDGGENIDEVDYNQRTILLELTKYHKFEANVTPELIELVVKLGADINYTIKRETAIIGRYEYETPLSNAVNAQNVEIVEVLLKHGANPNVEIDNGHPPHRDSGLNIIDSIHEDPSEPDTIRIVSLLKSFGAEKSISNSTSDQSGGLDRLIL